MKNARYKVSKRVLIWVGAAHNEFTTRLGNTSFSRLYQYPDGKNKWIIEGMMGNFTVIHWSYVNNPDKKKKHAAKN